MRRWQWFWGLVPLVVCCTAPEKRPSIASPVNGASPGTTPPNAGAVLAEEILKELGRNYTPREKSVTLSNDISVLRDGLTELEKNLEEVHRLASAALETNPGASLEIKAGLQEMQTGVRGLTQRMEQLERDVDTAMNDNLELREQIRSLVRSLHAYRDAYDESLHIRREALRRELKLLDELLVETQSAGSP
jgi:chromosome segregation ATPase